MREMWLCYTPLDAGQRTNRTYGYLSVKKPPMPGLIHAVWPFVVWFTENIFREDKAILEHEQRAYDAQGAGTMRYSPVPLCEICERCWPAAASSWSEGRTAAAPGPL